MYQGIDDEATKKANEHVEWFLSLLKPLLISHFVHGYKHGQDASDVASIKAVADALNQANVETS